MLNKILAAKKGLWSFLFDGSFFQMWFCYSGRIGRKTYALNFIILSYLYILALKYTTFTFTIYALLPYLYFVSVLVKKRNRDIGKSDSKYLLMFAASYLLSVLFYKDYNPYNVDLIMVFLLTVFSLTSLAMAVYLMFVKALDDKSPRLFDYVDEKYLPERIVKIKNRLWDFLFEGSFLFTWLSYRGKIGRRVFVINVVLISLLYAISIAYVKDMQLMLCSLIYLSLFFALVQKRAADAAKNLKLYLTFVPLAYVFYNLNIIYIGTRFSWMLHLLMLVFVSASLLLVAYLALAKAKKGDEQIIYSDTFYMAITWCPLAFIYFYSALTDLASFLINKLGKLLDMMF